MGAEVKEEGKLLRQQDGQYEEFAVVEAVVRRRVAQVAAADEGGGHGRSNESLLAGAMAMALAHVNRQQAAAPPGSKVLARMLVLSASGDSAAQYMNYMNVFFTAQKLNIPVDVCMIGQDSGLLQQGSGAVHQGDTARGAATVPDLAFPARTHCKEDAWCATSC